MVTQDLEIKYWNLATQGSLLNYSFCHVKEKMSPVMCMKDSDKEE